MQCRLNSKKNYIPSPLGSPAHAKRMTKRLGDQICRSPILSRARRRFSAGNGGGGGPAPNRLNGHSSFDSPLAAADYGGHAHVCGGGGAGLASRTTVLHQHGGLHAPQPQCHHHHNTLTSKAAPPSSGSSSSGGGLASFFSAFSMLTTGSSSSSSRKNKNHYNSKNLFLSPEIHEDFVDNGGVEMHQFGDTGRIANRYNDKHWDVW